MILICITVGTTAGPSSASLLIAQHGLWPTKSTYLTVNASLLDLWPDRLDDQPNRRGCTMVRYDSLEDAPRCPLSDIYDILQTETHGYFLDSLDERALLKLGVLNPDLPFARILVFSGCATSSKDQHCASIPMNEIMYRYWLTQNSRHNQFSGYQSVQRDYFQPYTIASCVTDFIKDSSDQGPLRFARISETESELKKDREIVSIPSLTKGQIIKNGPGDDSDFRVDWVDLPMAVFNTGIPGAVIVNSQDPNRSSYNIITCTLNAGWGSSILISSSQSSNSIHSSMSNTPSFWPIESTSVDELGDLKVSVPNFANFSKFLYPERRISVSKEWMELLNPFVSMGNNNLTGKYISLALSSLDHQPTEVNVARLLNILLGVAIADTGTGYDSEGIYQSLKPFSFLRG